MSYNDNRFKKITLNTQITLISEAIMSDDNGAINNQNIELPIYARLATSNPYSIQNYQNINENITARYIIRYRENITTKNAIKIRDDVYDIVDIENMLMANRYLIISLVLRGNNRKAQNGI